jgi:hypothetical protein
MVVIDLQLLYGDFKKSIFTIAGWNVPLRSFTKTREFLG